MIKWIQAFLNKRKMDGGAIRLASQTTNWNLKHVVQHTTRGVATCKHWYARAYLKKCRRLKRKETKKNDRNIKQTGNKRWLKKAQSLRQIPLFLSNINFSK